MESVAILDALVLRSMMDGGFTGLVEAAISCPITFTDEMRILFCSQEHRKSPAGPSATSPASVSHSVSSQRRKLFLPQ